MNYEEAILQVQGNGKYNLFSLLVLSIMGFNLAMDFVNIVFMSYTPRYECIDNAFNQTNVTWIKNQCFGKIQTTNETYQNVQCTKWKFDKDVMKRTMVTDFNLVCDKESYVTIMNTLVFVGISLGKFIAINGDKIGRIKMIQIFAVFEILINITLPFVTNIWIIFVLRFIAGFESGKINQGMCYIAEIISTEKRSLYINNYWIFYAVGYIMIPGIAYGTRDWRLIRHILNITMICYLFYFWMPESPRWLGSGGNIKKAKDNLLLIAKRNGQSLPDNHFDSLIVDKEVLGNWRDIFRKSVIRRKTFILMFVRGTFLLSYSALSINDKFISNNIFINVFVQGLLEILTGPLGWISSTKLNRKLSLILFFLMTSVCLVINNLMNDKTNLFIILKFSFGVIGKFCLTTGFCINDMYLNEVFPTSIRNMAIFLIIGISATFQIFAPTINGIDKYFAYFSLLFFSVLCMVSATLIYFLLPETKGCPLPQTLEQGEALRKGNEDNYLIMMNAKENDISMKFV